MPKYQIVVFDVSGGQTCPAGNINVVGRRRTLLAVEAGIPDRRLTNAGHQRGYVSKARLSALSSCVP